MHILTKRTSSMKRLTRHCVSVIFLTISLLGLSSGVHASFLPTVTGVTFDGERISWDAMDGAVGYNLYLDSRYIRTVKDTTVYVPIATGRYNIIAFDSVGNVSPLQTFDPDLPPITNFTFVNELNIDPAALTQSALQNARGSLYSKNAGEVFWGRVDSASTISYRISVNGEMVASTIGTSYWMPDLLPNEVTEVTISTNGDDIYGPGSVTLLLDSNTTDFPAQATVIDNPAEPETPTSLTGLPTVTGVRFDGTRLTWDAVDSAVGYNLYVDSRYQRTVRDATEFVADRAGTYRLVAFNEQGQFSPTVNPDGSATSNTTVVSEIDNNAFDSLMQPLETASAAIYSKTAGELFWDRENTRFDGVYVISVDGEYVARRTTDTSIVLNSLPRNRQVQVTISAQESDVEVAWVTFSFDTSVSRFPSAVPIIDQGIGAREEFVVTPVPEQYAELVIFSPTSAELYWSDPVDESNLITEIYRDGVLLGSTPFNDYLDETREPGTDYVYELVTLSASGERLASVFILPTAFGDDVETAANNIVSGIAGLTNNNPHVRWYPLFRSIAFGDIPEELVEESVRVDEDEDFISESRSFECTNNGGSMTLDRITDTFADRADYFLTFTDCDLGDVYVSGSVDITLPDESTENIDYSLFIEADGLLDMIGRVSEYRIETDDARTVTYDNVMLYEFGDSDIELVATLDQVVAYETAGSSGVSTLDSTITVSAWWTKGRDMSISTNETFSLNESAETYYSTGSLTIEDVRNGERMTLSADTGDNATWFAEVNTNEGLTDVSGNWNDENRLACITLEGDCE